VREFPLPRKPDKEIADGAIFNDIGAKSVGQLFRDYGRYFRKAKKNDEAGSRELLSSRFRNNKIIIHPDCVNFIAQLKGYLWDAKKLVEIPIQKEDDSIDCARYMCAECKPEDHARTERSPDRYRIDWKKRQEDQRIDPRNDQSDDDWQSW